MIRFVLTVLVLMVVFVFSSCFDKDENVPRNNPNQVFFQRNCAVCHGPNGEGKQIGEKHAPNLRSEKIINDSDEKLFQQISNGGGGMPAFKYQLDDDQIKEMVKYIRQEIQGKK
jgi:mono/diheme cytochrome c family protein